MVFARGQHFFSGEVGDSYIRPNFSDATENEAERGLAILVNPVRKPRLVKLISRLRAW